MCSQHLGSISFVRDAVTLKVGHGYETPPCFTHSYLILCLLTVFSNTTIHDLSPEILSSIFFIATHQIQDRFESIIIPTTISHVSSCWRDIAISTLGLWTTIILTFPICLSQLSRSKTWLSRSNTYPVDIFLDVRDPSWRWEEDLHQFNSKHMTPFLDLLLTPVERWRGLELLTDTWSPIFLFLWKASCIKAAP